MKIATTTGDFRDYTELGDAAAAVPLLWFGAEVTVLGVSFPMELFGLIGLGLIFCYEGRKVTTSKWIQWAFYLFYPVHLLVLWGLERLLF